MPRSVATLSFVFLIAAGMAVGEWWDKTPSTHWTLDQAYELLNDSPWVSSNQGYFQQHPLEIIRFQARILTAKPIQEAFLRLSVLEANVVTTKEINPATAAQESQKRLHDLITTHPDDLLVKGDEKHIIIAISQKIQAFGISGVKSSQEVFRSDELSNVDPSRILADTRLETDTGKRVVLYDYWPPGTHLAGAIYFFPRNLPNGTPLVSASDKELHFETYINKKLIRVKFDLTRMRYKGRLEI